RFYAHNSGSVDIASAILKRLEKNRSALVERLAYRSKRGVSYEKWHRMPRYVLSLAVLLAWSCPDRPDPKLLAELDQEHHGYTGSDYQVCRQLLLMLRSNPTGELVQAVLAEIPPTLRNNILEALVHGLSTTHFGSHASRRATIGTDPTLSPTQRNEWVRLYALCMGAIGPGALSLTAAPKRLAAALERLVSHGTQSPGRDSTAFAMIVAQRMHPVLVADLMGWCFARPWAWALVSSVENHKHRNGKTAATQWARSVRHSRCDEAEMLLTVLPPDIRESPAFVSMVARVRGAS
ncbi:hypothetical protein BC828DRAFT_407995, partial [Blastocladiella britannica]